MLFLLGSLKVWLHWFPSPKTDVLLIDNWRPICLLNNDYKIIALRFAKRIKAVLDTIIDEMQSGFLRKTYF